jgi:uncharacterized protein YrrD
MQFIEEADVVTADGRKVGQVDRVVMDPKTLVVTHLVVRKGFLFSRDKIVPIDQVDGVREDRIELGKGIENSDELPDFEETQYASVGDVASLKLPAAGSGESSTVRTFYLF